jgi:beta-galactosidase/beta-glucuronidase
MLFPQNNPYRHYVELNGFWEFRRDLDQQGEAKGWGDGFAPEGLLAVPASWNDQFATTKMRGFIGTMFYQNTFYIPSESRERAVRLRVGAVSFKASLEHMVARDRHHPSVIMWSVANEPHTEYEAARPYFQEIYDYTRSLDDTRPVVLVEHHGAHGGLEFIPGFDTGQGFGLFVRVGADVLPPP